MEAFMNAEKYTNENIMCSILTLLIPSSVMKFKISTEDAYAAFLCDMGSDFVSLAVRA